MNFATKTGVVASMLQETEKINEPVRMLVWIILVVISPTKTFDTCSSFCVL